MPFELFCSRYSVTQALRSEDVPKRDAALTAIKEELGNVLLMRALKPVMRGSVIRAEMECGVFPSHRFMKDKFKLGEFGCTKAILVVGGDYVAEKDAGEMASPTVNPVIAMI